MSIINYYNETIGENKVNKIIHAYGVNNQSKYLERMHKVYLKSNGVKLPKKGKLRIALEYLVKNMGKPVHIDDIKEYVINEGETLTGTDPLQVRHLSTQNGFYIVKGNNKYEHKLITLICELPGFIKEKRNISINNKIWKSIMKEYDYMCVNCGSKQDDELRWKKTEITKLQKGHMDPRKGLTEDNCIPQCQFCNQRSKDKHVFDKRGQVIEII